MDLAIPSPVHISKAIYEQANAEGQALSLPRILAGFINNLIRAVIGESGVEAAKFYQRLRGEEFARTLAQVDNGFRQRSNLSINNVILEEGSSRIKDEYFSDGLLNSTEPLVVMMNFINDDKNTDFLIQTGEDSERDIAIFKAYGDRDEQRGKKIFYVMQILANALRLENSSNIQFGSNHSVLAKRIMSSKPGQILDLTESESSFLKSREFLLWIVKDVANAVRDDFERAQSMGLYNYDNFLDLLNRIANGEKI